MARPRKVAEGESDLTPAQRAVQALKKDKDIGGVVKLADEDLVSDVRYYVSTQAPSLDYAIGQPGIPSGKITTIFGPEGSAKSTLVYHLLAEVQKMGGIGVLIDSEQRYTKERAVAIGIDPSNLIIIDGATLEQAFKSIEDIIDKLRADPDSESVPILVAYDSIAGSATDKALAMEVGQQGQAGYVAKFLGEELKRIKLKISKTSVALVLVNQIRSHITNFDPRTRGQNLRRKVMGEQHSMLAEWPLLFESVLMLRSTTIGPIGDKDEPIGLRSRVSVRKSGISPNEGYSAELEVYKMTGIDSVGSTFDLLEKMGVIIGGGGGRYRLEHDANAPSFFKKDFGKVLDNHPELGAMITAAPTLWMSGDEPQVVSSEEGIFNDDDD